MSAASRKRRKKRQGARAEVVVGTETDFALRPIVYLATSPPNGSTVSDTRSVQRYAEERGWTFHDIHCVEVTAQRGVGQSRRVQVLTREDAERLYAQMHRCPVAVLFGVELQVRTRPYEAVRAKDLIHISRFCMYKAFTMNLNGNQASDWAGRFHSWMNAPHCDGTGDPRVLPFHMFRPQRIGDEPNALDRLEERQLFRSGHYRNAAWIDADGRRWAAAEPHARHGREPQFVGKTELPLGFHWDVKRGGGTKIYTPTAVWQVRRDAHINIYPDGHVRPGPGTGCQLIWDKKSSRQADKVDLSRQRS